MKSIYKLIVPIQTVFRGRRMRRFETLFTLRDGERIVDVGGRAFNWLLLEKKPKVTLVNLEPQEEDARFDYVYADGTRLPYADGSFDLCYSNSVIEHVGDRDKRAAFAREVRRIAPRYYVQTPNKWFFAEPHTVGPFVHWLPKSWQRRLIRWCTLWGLVDRPSQAKIDALLDEIDLIGVAEMRRLFPDATILKERFLFFTKSIIAVRT